MTTYFYHDELIETNQNTWINHEEDWETKDANDNNDTTQHKYYYGIIDWAKVNEKYKQIFKEYEIDSLSNIDVSRIFLWDKDIVKPADF